MFIIGLLLLVSCGSDDASNGSATAGSESISQLVQTAGDLPDCNDGIDGQLVYVTSDQVFKYCSANAWTDIDLRGEQGASGAAGSDGEDGGSVSAIYNLVSNEGDLCTFYSNVGCIFLSGSMVVFENGNVQIHGGRYQYYSTTTGGEEDVDEYFQYNTVWSLEGVLVYAGIGLIHRDSSTGKVLWMVYDPDSGDVSLVFDLDNDGVLSAGDELIEVLNRVEI